MVSKFEAFNFRPATLYLRSSESFPFSTGYPANLIPYGVAGGRFQDARLTTRSASESLPAGRSVPATSRRAPSSLPVRSMRLFANPGWVNGEILDRKSV